MLPGNYALNLRLSTSYETAPSQSPFWHIPAYQITLDGNTVSFNEPSTSGRTAYGGYLIGNVESQSISLGSGTHTLRIEALSTWARLESMQVEAQ